MSKTYFPGYMERRHSPRLTMARMRGWKEHPDRPGSLMVPRCFGRLLYTPATGEFTRILRNGKERKVKTPYKLIRQDWQTIQCQIAKQGKIEQAQIAMKLVRTELIKAVKKTAPEDVKAWQAILRDIDRTLIGIHHDSVKQIRERLKSMFGSNSLEDSIGRPNQSGPAQAKLRAAEGRADEIIEDIISMKLGVTYYYAVVQEMIHEIENNLNFVEIDLYALNKRSFRNKRYSQMRETQAARYCVNNIIDTLDEYFWCSPFIEFREELRALAMEIRDLCPRDAEDFDTALWVKIEENSGKMMAIVNRLMIRVEMEHLRQCFAESVVQGWLTPEVRYRFKAMQNRCIEYGCPNPGVERLVWIIDENIDLGGTTKTPKDYYDLVGETLDAENGEVAAATA